MNKLPNKILFLDYDGVLHGDSVYLEHRHPVLRGSGIEAQYSVTYSGRPAAEGKW